jgi:hypothetical protein
MKENGFKVYCLFVEDAQEKEKFLSIFDDYRHIESINQISENDFDLLRSQNISSDTFEKNFTAFLPCSLCSRSDYYCPKALNTILIKG